MARVTRAEVFGWDEIAIVHTMSQVVRQSYLLGTDHATGKCYDHRREWIETELKRLASGLAIDLLCYSLMSSHIHLVLRSRPDVVAQWDDTEAARRWLIACPLRKGSKEPTEADLNSIRYDPVKLKAIRQKLSSISTWMKLLCQRISIRANREDDTRGAFFASRFKGINLLDEASILACAAYVGFRSAKAAIAVATFAEQKATLSEPVKIDEQNDPLGPRVNQTSDRASDNGFLPISEEEYIELLDWTARQVAPGKRGSTPLNAPPIFERLQLSSEQWCRLVSRSASYFIT